MQRMQRLACWGLFAACALACFRAPLRGSDFPADRDAYLVHPDHKAFGVVLKDVIDDVFVLDFVPKE